MERFFLLIAFISLPFLTFSQDKYDENAGFKYLESISRADDVQFGEECVFTDASEKVCYVDFQKIKLNLKEILVIDQEGNVVYSKDVSQLPVDTILEIDLSSGTKDKYVIELRSYIKSLHRLINFS